MMAQPDVPVVIPPREGQGPSTSPADSQGPQFILEPLQARRLGVLTASGSLVVSLILLTLYHEMGGPGDELTYHQQAARLIPFTDHYYGPGYFLALRLVHDLLSLDWFLAGKLVSWASAVAFLLICHRLFRQLLRPDACWMALVIVALNPTFIGQSYSAHTIMFGATCLLLPITLTVGLPVHQPRQWLLPGVAFGIAYLTRFQALGFLAGAVAGTFVVHPSRITARARCALWLAAGAAIPVLAWYGLLLALQGHVPENHNFVHLTAALGQFRTFFEVPDLVRQYGSFWGVLTSTRSAPFEIATFAAKEAVKFPFGVGFQLLFIAAGWLVPGCLVALVRRDTHAPWAGAFTVGLLLTGIGSQGWGHYYLIFVPFAAVLMALAIERLDRPGTPSLARLSWWVTVGTTALWSPPMVRSGFRASNWSEFAMARAYIERSRDSSTVVSATAASFAYGTTIPFVDQSTIMRPDGAEDLAARLREHRVTKLIVTERHTLYEFPDLRYLLEDSIRDPPPGLRRDTLIVTPRRLAILTVVASVDSSAGHANSGRAKSKGGAPRK